MDWVVPLSNSLKLVCLTLFAAACLAAAGCGEPAGSPAGTAAVGESATPAVLVTHPVLLEAARAMSAGTEISVRAAIPDPAASREWRPQSRDVRTMQQAVLVVMNGASWEPWTSRVSLPASRVVVTSQPFESELIRIPDAITHQHGPEGRHSHAGTVTATWLSPVLLEAQTDALADALRTKFPQHSDVLARQVGALKAGLQQPRRLAEQLRDVTQSQRPFVITDSPLYLYLLRDLGWEGRYLTGQESGLLEPEQLVELDKAAAESPDVPLRLFLVNDQRPADVDAVAAQRKLQVVRMDLCLTAVEGKTVGQRLAGNLQRLLDVVQKN